MSDLHAAISAEIDELERLATAADGDHWDYHCVSLHMDGKSSGPVTVVGTSRPAIAHVGTNYAGPHIATWDPATVLRGLAEDRDILARHTANAGIGHCWHDAGWVQWPCGEIRSLARRHGIEVPS